MSVQVLKGSPKHEGAGLIDGGVQQQSRRRGPRVRTDQDDLVAHHRGIRPVAIGTAPRANPPPAVLLSELQRTTSRSWVDICGHMTKQCISRTTRCLL